MSNRWVYERGTGKWMLDFRDPSQIHVSPALYGVAEIPKDAPQPDPILDRYDVAAQTNRRATPAERQESKQEALTAEAIGFLGQHKMTRALLVVIADLHGLSSAELRARILAAYKAL